MPSLWNERAMLIDAETVTLLAPARCWRMAAAGRMAAIPPARLPNWPIRAGAARVAQPAAPDRCACGWMRAATAERGWRSASMPACSTRWNAWPRQAAGGFGPATICCLPVWRGIAPR